MHAVSAKALRCMEGTLENGDSSGNLLLQNALAARLDFKQIVLSRFSGGSFRKSTWTQERIFPFTSAAKRCRLVIIQSPRCLRMD